MASIEKATNHLGVCMARALVLALDGEQTSFNFKPLDRADLYGKRVRVALDKDGERCTRASLLEDGLSLIHI